MASPSVLQFTPMLVASTGPLNFLLPFVVAPVVAFGLGASWHFILGLWGHTQKMRPERAWRQDWGLFSLSWAADCRSASTAVLSGTSALQEYQLTYFRNLKRVADVVAINDAADESVIAAFDAGATAMRAGADAENVSGLVSGLRGRSIVYNSLLNAANSLSAMTTTLKNLAQDRNEGLARAERNYRTRPAAASHQVNQFEKP